MKKISELETELQTLKLELDLIRPQYEALSSRYFELSRKHTKLIEEINERKKRSRQSTLEWKCRYEEPTYPRMGESGSNGTAYFTDQAEAEELIALLCSRSYYYGYDFKWQGPGHYDVIPDWKYDHDREVIYTAIFQKAEEEHTCSHPDCKGYDGSL